MKHSVNNKKMFIAVFIVIIIASLPLTQALTYNLSYDANGNLVTGDGKFRVYNSLNQLVQLYNGTNTSGILLQEYSYHPVEERILVKKTYSTNGSLKETVVYVSEDFVQIINNSGTFNLTYVHANNQQVAQILPNGSTQYLLGDNKGNTVVTTNSGGGVVERTSYTPYGGISTGGVSSRFNYEGRENDATAGDTDFRFRKYNPTWSIFNQPDNKIFDTYDPQTLNRYTFEKNNPYKNKDPTGHDGVLLTIVGIYVISYVIGFVYGYSMSMTEQSQDNTVKPDENKALAAGKTEGLTWTIGATVSLVSIVVSPWTKTIITPTEGAEYAGDVKDVISDINK